MSVHPSKKEKEYELALLKKEVEIALLKEKNAELEIAQLKKAKEELETKVAERDRRIQELEAETTLETLFSTENSADLASIEDGSSVVACDYRSRHQMTTGNSAVASHGHVSSYPTGEASVAASRVHVTPSWTTGDVSVGTPRSRFPMSSDAPGGAVISPSPMSVDTSAATPSQCSLLLSPAMWAEASTGTREHPLLLPMLPDGSAAASGAAYAPPSREELPPVATVREQALSEAANVTVGSDEISVMRKRKGPYLYHDLPSDAVLLKYLGRANDEIMTLWRAFAKRERGDDTLKDLGAHELKRSFFDFLSANKVSSVEPLFLVSVKPADEEKYDKLYKSSNGHVFGEARDKDITDYVEKNKRRKSVANIISDYERDLEKLTLIAPDDPTFREEADDFRRTLSVQRSLRDTRRVKETLRNEFNKLLKRLTHPKDPSDSGTDTMGHARSTEDDTMPPA